MERGWLRVGTVVFLAAVLLFALGISGAGVSAQDEIGTSIFSEEQVTFDPYQQKYPYVFGPLIVWRDNRNDPYSGDCFGCNEDVYFHSLATGVERALSLNPAAQYVSSLNGSRVAYTDWRDDRTGFDTDVYVGDLILREEELITPSPGGASGAKISGNLLVWSDSRHGNSDIYVKDLSTGLEGRLVASAGSPQISGNIVVWADGRNEPDTWKCLIDIHHCNIDIYMIDIATGVESPLVVRPDYQCCPAINGNIVTWFGFDGVSYFNVFYKDLSTGLEGVVPLSEPALTSPPDVSGNVIVWADQRNEPFNIDIYAYDIQTKQEIPITTNPVHQDSPAISGSMVIWDDWRNDDGSQTNSDIFMAALGPVSVSIVPQDVIVNPGGSVNSTAVFYNHSARIQIVKAWAEVIGAGGRTFKVSGPNNIILRPKQVLIREISQRLPAGTPHGSYTYKMNVGRHYPNPVMASDAFNFGVVP